MQLKPFAFEKGIFENLGVIDLPFNLDIAKKSLVSTMSALYATMSVSSKVAEMYILRNSHQESQTKNEEEIG